MGLVSSAANAVAPEKKTWSEKVARSVGGALGAITALGAYKYFGPKVRVETI